MLPPPTAHQVCSIAGAVRDMTDLWLVIGRTIPSGQFRCSAVLVAGMAFAGPAEAQAPPPPPEHPVVYACSLEREDLEGTVLAERQIMIEPEAPFVTSAQFTPSGLILGVDRESRQVMLLDQELNVHRVIGREGPGPGEYELPVAATMDETGRIFVADGGRAGSVVVFREDGSFLRESQLPLVPTDLTTDGSLVYLSSVARHFAALPSGAKWLPQPLVVAYDPATGESRVLLEFDDSWAGRPPLYWSGRTETIPRIGQDGHLYLAFVQPYEIWRITDTEQHEVVVRGCVPRAAMRMLRAPMTPDGQWRVDYSIVQDFMVFADGRLLVVNGMHVDDGERRSQDLFSPDGGLLRSWTLGPASVLALPSAIDPVHPELRLTWSEYDGTTRLLRFPPFSK